MAGMGRCGTLHAWEQEGIVPDLQAIGKGLGGGYAPVSGVLIGDQIVQALDKGTGAFRHGQTYQGHPISCAAALAVQRVIKEQNLLANVREMGSYLGARLKSELGDHPNVGDIRGRGLFWGVCLSTVYSIPYKCQWAGLMNTDRIRQRQNNQRTFPHVKHGSIPHPGNGNETLEQHLAVCGCGMRGRNPGRSHPPGTTV